MRETDPIVVAKALSEYQDIIGDEFNPILWVADDKNIVLRKGDSFSLFQYDSPGVYTGHYFFSKGDRGKKAIVLGKQMLAEVFDEHGAKVVRGLTPLQNLPARWTARQLGFESFGVVSVVSGPCELFIQTAEQFRSIGNNNG